MAVSRLRIFVQWVRVELFGLAVPERRDKPSGVRMVLGSEAMQKHLTCAPAAAARRGRCHPERTRPARTGPGPESRAGPARGGSGRHWSRSRCLSAGKLQRTRLRPSRGESLRDGAAVKRFVLVLVWFVLVLEAEIHHDSPLTAFPLRGSGEDEGVGR